MRETGFALAVLRFLQLIAFGFVGLALSSGCAVDAEALNTIDSRAPVRGPGLLDAGAPNSPDATPSTDGIAADLLGVAPDSLSPDAGLVDGRPPTFDTIPASDLRPAVDVLPDVLPAACTKAGAWTQTTAMLIALPVEGSCVAICPDSTAAIDYAWACLGFDAKDRNLAVNGKPIAACGSKDLPPLVHGAWALTFTAGGSGTHYIQWSGVLRACP